MASRTTGCTRRPRAAAADQKHIYVNRGQRAAARPTARPFDPNGVADQRAPAATAAPGRASTYTRNASALAPVLIPRSNSRSYRCHVRASLVGFPSRLKRIDDARQRAGRGRSDAHPHRATPSFSDKSLCAGARGSRTGLTQWVRLTNRRYWACQIVRSAAVRLFPAL